jgi:hypothetical protein
MHITTRVILLHCQIREFEGRVRLPIFKRKQRLDLVFLISAIPTKDAFLIVNPLRVTFRIVGCEGRIILLVSFKSCRQMPRRINVAEQNLRQRSAAGSFTDNGS